MNMEIEPPRSLPLRVMGWMSLPWRHWIYIIGTLIFGLLFVTLAPVPFLVRVLVLLIPFFTALGLAIPYGGLHMDEWILLAFKYRLRPTTAMISLEELKGQAPDDLERFLEAPPEKPALALPGPSGADDQPARRDIEQEAAEQPSSVPDVTAGITGTQQIYLTGTYGILRRSYGGLPESPRPGSLSGTPAPASGPIGPTGQPHPSWQSAPGLPNNPTGAARWQPPTLQEHSLPEAVGQTGSLYPSVPLAPPRAGQPPLQEPSGKLKRRRRL